MKASSLTSTIEFNKLNNKKNQFDAKFNKENEKKSTYESQVENRKHLIHVTGTFF